MKLTGSTFAAAESPESALSMFFTTLIVSPSFLVSIASFLSVFSFYLIESSVDNFSSFTGSFVLMVFSSLLVGLSLSLERSEL